jgi:serine/threonine protein kinase
VHPGLMVSQSVRLSRVLGAGGMGSVWVADHLALKIQVVVKFMSAELVADPASRERFQREAEAASQVKSPHVVQTFDHGVTPSGVPFIVMEHLEGQDLGHRIGRGPMTVASVVAVIAQVGRALARAHSVGIVHRDIKPDNIFLCDVGGEEPFVKILDFGIAKTNRNPAAGSHTRTGAMLGTPYYMSPEQFAGAKGIDHRTDLWSLAVVAYECFSGVRPFDAETIGGLAIAVHTANPSPPSSLRPGLPKDLDPWFRRALAREPGARFQSAKEFTDTLALAASERMPRNTPALDGPPLAPSPAPQATDLLTSGGAGALENPVSPVRSAVARRTRWAVAVGVGAVALATVLMTMASRSVPERRGATEATATTSNADPTPVPSPSAATPAAMPAATAGPEPTLATADSGANLGAARGEDGISNRASPLRPAASISRGSSTAHPTLAPAKPPASAKPADANPFEPHVF